MVGETSVNTGQSPFTHDSTLTGGVSKSTPATRSLFDLISEEPGIAAHSESTEEDSPSFLERFLAERDPLKAIAGWLLRSCQGGVPTSARKALRRLNHDLGQLDQILNTQLNQILHHSRFQKLEASWRGLRYLVEECDPNSNCKIRMLSLSWPALARDLDRAIEFDQSQFFKKIYSQEFGTAGGEPFSVLIGDYEMSLRPTPEHRTDDIASLKLVAQVAAAAFAPFITSAHPSLLGLDSFQELERPADLNRMFEQKEYTAWNALRKQADSRFLALTLPRILLRREYEGRKTAGAHFPFQELIEDSGRDYLWGNAAYAMGAVILRSFAQNGWLADIRGVRQDREEGGVVTGLPEVFWKTDQFGVAVQSPVEVVIPETLESNLCNQGFISLSACDTTGLPAFHMTPSLQRPEVYDSEQATMSARLSSMLHYTLCVSRIAHYIKVLGREKIGSYTEPADCQEYLNDWLRRYVTQDDDAAAEVKARYPLREAEATILERPGEPGNYYCTIYLQPHYQLDDMVSAVKLMTELSPVQPS